MIQGDHKSKTETNSLKGVMFACCFYSAIGLTPYFLYHVFCLLYFFNNILQVAIPDVKDAAKDCDILVFVLPHQFVRGVCNSLKGTLKPGTISISLIKVRGHVAVVS
jgi:hypothetical protein